VSVATIKLCVGSQRMFIILVVVDFVIDSVGKRLDTPTYVMVLNRALLIN